MVPHADGCGFIQDAVDDSLPGIRGREHFQDESGASFLHTGVLDKHIQGTLIEELILEELAEDFSAGIVDIRLDNHDFIMLRVRRGFFGGFADKADAQDVGMGELFFSAAPAAFGEGDHGKIESGFEGFEDGDSGGGGHFGFNGALEEGDAVQEQFGGRGRYGHSAVGAVHESVSRADGFGEDPFYVQSIQKEGRTGDVDDGINGAHFVKVDALFGGAVNGGFGFGDEFEYFHGEGFGAFAEG